MNKVFKILFLMMPIFMLAQNEGIRPWEFQNASDNKYMFRSQANGEYKHELIIPFLRDSCGFTTGGYTGSVTNNYLPYVSASNTLSDSPLYRVGSTQIGLNTTSGANLLGRAGLNIMSSDPAFVIGKSTSQYWYHYLSGNDYQIYNPNYGAVLDLKTNGELQMGKYSGGGNKYAYWDNSGVMKASLYDAIGGTGSAGYMARWFSSGVQDYSGLYCSGQGSGLFGIGTTSPATYLGSSTGINIYGIDPRIALTGNNGATTNNWIHYLSGTAGATYNIFSGTLGDNILSIDNNGTVRVPYKLGFTVSSAVNVTGLMTYSLNGAVREFRTGSVGTGLSLSTSGVLTNTGVITEVDGVIGNEVTGADGNGLATTGSGTGGSPYRITLAGKPLQLANLAYDNGKVLQSTGSTLQWATMGTVTSVAAGQGLYALTSNPITSTGTVHSLATEFAYMSNGGISSAQSLTGPGYVSVVLSGGNSNSNLGAFTLDASNNEIDVLVTGLYEIEYSLGFISDQTSLVSTRVTVGGVADPVTVRAVSSTANLDMNIPGTRTVKTINSGQSVRLQYSCSVGAGVSHTAQYRTPTLFIKRIN